jgi:hypothetical protein
VTEQSSEGDGDAAPAMVPILVPTVLDAHAWAPVPSHLSLTPEKRISLYDDVQWEEFVLEWATTLTYEQVMRSGGAHDHGVDVAGFVTAAGFDGPWDCYQCKHYGKALLPSDAYPEILKVVLGTLSGHYTWPRQYRFAAPHGVGTTLAGVVHSPTKLKTELVKALTKDKSPLASHLGPHSIESVQTFVKDADFSVFGTLELHELVDAHAETRWHSARFGVELPTRPPPPEPSPDPTDEEQRYIAQLLKAYGERHGGTFTASHASENEDVGAHFLRQRVAFYSAEALRVFARDSVPEGTFAALQQDIFDGVIDTHDLDHPDGLHRLVEVTKAAQGLAITSNGLLPVLAVRDRTGICHQLANEDQLRWCHAASQ